MEQPQDDLLIKFGHAGVQANNVEFLSDDPACRLQLRRVLPSDFPPAWNLHGATALLILRKQVDVPPIMVPVRFDRTPLRNSRKCVRHAVDCLAAENPSIGRHFRKVAEAQTVWGEPDEMPPTPSASLVRLIAPTTASKRARRRMRRRK